MNKTLCFNSLLFFCLALIVSSSPASAHFPWINAADYSISPGSSPDLTIGWGHAYPFAPFLKKDSVEGLSLSGPGKILPRAVFESDMEISTEAGLTTPGAYIVSLSRKPGFHTKTATGYHSSSKEGLDNVIACSYSHMGAKAILTVGDGKGKVDTPVGHPLEIIPLTNPSGIRPGDMMDVKILYKGNPWSGLVYATYAGFSTEKETFAYTTKTDKQGVARIRMLTHGVWLIKASQEEDYPDAAQCDIEKYLASLTFEIK